MKVMKMLAPKKYAENDFTAELTVREFSALFRSDPIRDKMVKIIKREAGE